jgi:hypothetical protein
MAQPRRIGLALVSVAAVLAACGELTAEEAQQALDEASLSSAAVSLAGNSIELSTHFTIGSAVNAAATELSSFVQSQLPCAQITVSGATLTIQYGAVPGNCTFEGQTYAGTHTITIMSNGASEVAVEHQWTNFHNQTVSVTGSAMVTWSAADATRHVSHSLTWTRSSDMHTGTGTGDWTQMALPGGILVGFAESGQAHWTSSGGTWALTIASVQMRWIDPCPQAGTYTLTTPAGKTLTLSFNRTDQTTIAATIESGGHRYEIDVHTL